jgi:hypothetical protein
MRIAKYYSHLNGWEWLQVRRPGFWAEIEAIIQRIDANQFKTKVSKERRMKGQLKYSPVSLNAEFDRLLSEAGWREARVSYWVTDEERLIRQTIDEPEPDQKRLIEAEGKTPIFSYNQTDFVKDKVAIEVQFGKYPFIAYDVFVKHLAF